MFVDVSGGRDRSATRRLDQAIQGAVAARRHLVVVLGPIVPDAETLASLVAVFDCDPLFGTAQPRFADDSGDHVWPLPGATDRADGSRPSARRVLSWLPIVTVTPELLAACLVLRWNALTAVSGVDHTYGGTVGALSQLLCGTRRCGFRNAVLNTAVVPSALPYGVVYPVLDEADRQRLQRAFPDSALAEAELTALRQRRLERVLTAAHSQTERRRMLLDCRSLPSRHDGTARCVLGYLDGFGRLDHGFVIDILVSREAAAFHSLPNRYPTFHVVFDGPANDYFAAVCLTHPWALNNVADLHRHALLIAFVMLDTIGWDVLYTDGATTVGTVWRFIARHADVLLYISQFTRDRFNVRFPRHPGVAERVTHLSVARDELIDPAAVATEVQNYILVFGNHHDHKHVGPTARLLSDAFPLHPVVAFGLDGASSGNITALPSGQIGRDELHRLIAGARVIVFPSFYEGFGFPVIEGLAYGRPVVVRRSALWREVAGVSRLPGGLIEFDDVPSLVEAVGRALADRPANALACGDLLDGTEPADWKECAARILAALNECLPTADGRRWRERDEALGIAGLV